MPLELARTPEHARDHLAHTLRSPSADDQIRGHVRVVPGPQPYNHAHFAADQFFAFDPTAGAVHDVYGRRLLRVTGNFLHALSATMTAEAGDGAGEALYKIGFRWGTADIRTFTERIQQEYEVEFEKLGMGLMLESWWWPLRASGWGTWRFDLRHARNGLILIDLYASGVAAVPGADDRCACHLHAGLFAAVFSHLSGRTLAGVELRCAAKGGDRCRFLVATAKRVEAARFWRDDGLEPDELAQKLITTPTT